MIAFGWWSLRTLPDTMEETLSRIQDADSNSDGTISKSEHAQFIGIEFKDRFELLVETGLLEHQKEIIEPLYEIFKREKEIKDLEPDDQRATRNLDRSKERLKKGISITEYLKEKYGPDCLSPVKQTPPFKKNRKGVWITHLPKIAVQFKMNDHDDSKTRRFMLIFNSYNHPWNNAVFNFWVFLVDNAHLLFDKGTTFMRFFLILFFKFNSGLITAEQDDFHLLALHVMDCKSHLIDDILETRDMDDTVKKLQEKFPEDLSKPKENFSCRRFPPLWTGGELFPYAC